MKIDSDDKTLIFDITPESEVQLLVAKPGGDYRWISCEGEFVDGRFFKHNVNLPKVTNPMEQNNYQIRVENATIVIESLS